MNFFSIFFLQSFKRRYFYLKQQADTTYVMEFHKDDKKLEAKGSIFLDSAIDVARVNGLIKCMFLLKMAWTAQSHYLNQCWNMLDWTLRNKLQWNPNRNPYISIKENAYENVVWKMAAILPQPQWVKLWW